jgi:iron complex transport system ATP-binding protein
MLDASNITINYGSRVAVAGVSLKLNAGEVTAIIGPNGAGKSTLLRALNGAVKTASGEIELAGVPLTSYSRRSISRRIAAVAQEADLRFPVTVLEFVLGGRYAWAGEFVGLGDESRPRNAEAVLCETQLHEFADE